MIVLGANRRFFVVLGPFPLHDHLVIILVYTVSGTTNLKWFPHLCYA